jgi:hypothetical protein
MAMKVRKGDDRFIPQLARVGRNVFVDECEASTPYLVTHLLIL